MQKSGSELLVYGLVIAGFLLFNYLMQYLARRERELQEAAAAREAPDPPAEDEVLENIWGQNPVAAPPEPEPETALASVPRARASAAAPPRARRSAAARRLFRTRRDLRQAIVLMTVLGPCRALEPPENRG